MAVGQRALVEVFPRSAFEERPRLFAALAQALPVDFRSLGDGSGDADAVVAVVTSRTLELPPDLPASRGPILIVGGSPSVAGDREPVALRDVPELDRRLRGIELHDRLVGSPRAADSGAIVLADARSGPAWTLSADGPPIHRAYAVLTELGPDQVLWSLLSQRAIAAVALIQFLRAVCGHHERRPSLRATFMFDDPNLRWRSYGFLGYQRLVDHADAHGYHASMAMVPLDAGRTHPPTASLFTRRADRLSLVYHGNDHVRQELRSLRDPEQALAVAAQARRRIDRFERRSGLAVDRVMTPPHGLCSEATLGALAAVGFDAVSAEHPLPWREDLPADRLLAAWRPADLAGGLPVIPRMPLDSSPASIALRAFLNQPLVIYGHHGDLAGGLERLATVAAFVNAMGDVRWLSMRGIAASNWEAEISGDLARVRLYSRRVQLQLDSDIESVTVEAPIDLTGSEPFSGWSLGGGPVLAFGRPAPTPGATTVDIAMHGGAAVDPNRIAAPPWRPWPRLRRGAAEARDRALPLVSAARAARPRSR